MFFIRTLLLALMTAGLAVQAQQEVDINELPDLQYVEADEGYEDTNGQLRRKGKKKKNDVVQVQEENLASPKQGVVILNSNTNSNQNRADAVLQPPTYVEASPLTDSKAEQLRRARQAAEVNTEQKIVEKLEVSRLKDERDRANRLFGDRWQRPEETQQQPAPVQQAPIQPVPVYGQYEQPKQTVEVVNVDEDKEDLTSVKEEIIEAVKEVQAERMTIEQATPEPEDPKDRYYVGAVLGMSDYSADNVEGNGAGGFSLGTITKDGVIIEGTFLYSNYYLDQWWQEDFFKEIDQYNFGISAKYSPLSGRILPYAGAHLSYTYRKYTDRTYEYYTSSRDRRGARRYSSDPYPQDEEVTSNAVDVGFLLGLDFFVTKSFSIGAEYKYSMNMFNKSESDFINRSDWRAPENSEPLENIDYSVFGITGKVAF